MVKSKLLKAKKRAKARARKSVERQDYRQGGRVAFQRGGPRGEPSEKDIRDARTGDSFSVSRDEENRLEREAQPVEATKTVTEAPVMPSQPTEKPTAQSTKTPTMLPGEEELQPIEPPEFPTGEGLGTPKTKEQAKKDREKYERPSIATAERDARIDRTSGLIESAARGKVPGDAVIQDPSDVDTTIAAETKQMTDEDLAKAKAGQATTTDVTAVTGTAATTDAPDRITAATMDAAQTGSAVAEAAQGQVSEDAELTEDEIAEAADVVDVAPIEGADVEIQEGALTDRVVGVMSEGAKAAAAQNTGSSLRKLSRAKKQLRKAGLTEDQIGEIGDDIEALEDRLDDFTEEERGLIAGVDKDTLVDAQMNRLLDGMEEGEIPIWAQGAVSRVESMLAARGLSASSVGRAQLTNAILQSALPMAQSNATALQQAATQQRDIEAREAEANTQRRQQTALDKANKIFSMDMAQFSSDQQIALSNSRFLQTVSLTEASNEQQATVQNAVIQSQINLAEADAITKLTAQNAQAFLQMDMSNLSNRQQGNMFTAQAQQQALLSNQAATNAARQFNAASENQTNQFMANLSTQVALNNTQQLNAMEQFNTQQTNLTNAQNANRAADVSKLNAQLETQINQYNSQQEFAKNQWNVQNAQAIEQANTQWRRQANTINTAAQNAVNQQNAQNAFAMSSQAQTFLWQELRDQADYNFKANESELQRKASLAIAALGNDGLVYKGRNVSSALNAALGAINNFAFGSYTAVNPAQSPGFNR